MIAQGSFCAGFLPGNGGRRWRARRRVGGQAFGHAAGVGRRFGHARHFGDRRSRERPRDAEVLGQPAVAAAQAPVGVARLGRSALVEVELTLSRGEEGPP